MRASVHCPHESCPPSLREAGLKQTPQRQAILAVLQAAERPLTVEEIAGQMVGKPPGLPTIYRNLERFIGEGWAECMVGEDQVQRFVRCHSSHHHHHILCEGCGRTAETDCPGLDTAFENLAKASGFKVTRHKLTLYGLCPECQRGFSA
ncbi:Fur family transcriptional regulator [Holophaga foetida]|uniref:Fur family transcriptional regulator n=1 Tax=Holophaga foetida TaxID=35839 RepID=UPI00024750B2|nr:Fur family transcriptional regulator [Holophaga foetida]